MQSGTDNKHLGSSYHGVIKHRNGTDDTRVRSHTLPVCIWVSFITKTIVSLISKTTHTWGCLQSTRKI